MASATVGRVPHDDGDRPEHLQVLHAADTQAEVRAAQLARAMLQQADEIRIGDAALRLAGRDRGEAVRAEQRLGVSAQPGNELREARKRGRPDGIDSWVSRHGQSSYPACRGALAQIAKNWRVKQIHGAGDL
jgi:hypothetical protein